MTSCVNVNEFDMGSFCSRAEKIELNEEEIRVGQRHNKEIIALYNCRCVGDKQTCKGIDDANL